MNKTQWRKCEKCNGKGMILDVRFNGWYFDQKDVICPRCYGKGKYKYFIK